MGLEQTFERIADSLDRIASTLEENTKINAWYKSHLCKCDGSCAPDAPPPEELAATETTTETVVADKPAAPAEPSYDELKERLIARGVEIPKGTKMTTLKKLWEKYQNTAPIKAAEPAPAQVEEPAAESATEEEDNGLDSLLFGLAPVKEETPVMTCDECRKIITAEYKKEYQSALVKALVACGVKAFADLKEGQYEGFVAEFRKQKEALDAGK